MESENCEGCPVATGEVLEDVNGLREQLLKLQSVLGSGEKYCQHLKNENSRLSEELDKVIQEHCKSMDDLRQENHTLHMRLAQQLKMAQDYEEDSEGQRASLVRQHAHEMERVARESEERAGRLNKQLVGMQNDLADFQQKEQQLESDKQQLLAAAAQLREQLRQLQQAAVSSGENSADLAELSSVIQQLTDDKAELRKQLIDAQSSVSRQERVIGQLKRETEEKEREIEELECRSTSYYNSLERCREELQEVRVELDLANADANKIKEKGNSLFSEVEDRRVEAEKELITAKTRIESLKRQLTLSRQSLIATKNQVAALLQASAGSSRDDELKEHLTSLARQLRGELEILTRKLHDSELREEELRRRLAGSEALTSGTDEGKSSHSGFLQIMLQSKEEEISKTRDELRLQRMMTLVETDKVIRRGQELHAAERRVKELDASNYRLRARHDELLIKYEPDTLIKGTVRQTRVEKISVQSDYSSPQSSTAPPPRSSESSSGHSAGTSSTHSACVPGGNIVGQSADVPGGSIGSKALGVRSTERFETDENRPPSETGKCSTDVPATGKTQLSRESNSGSFDSSHPGVVGRSRGSSSGVGQATTAS